jgi:hypothetical protein
LSRRARYSSLGCRNRACAMQHAHARASSANPTRRRPFRTRVWGPRCVSIRMARSPFFSMGCGQLESPVFRLESVGWDRHSCGPKAVLRPRDTFPIRALEAARPATRVYARIWRSVARAGASANDRWTRTLCRPRQSRCAARFFSGNSCVRAGRPAVACGIPRGRKAASLKYSRSPRRAPSLPFPGLISQARLTAGLGGLPGALTHASIARIQFCRMSCVDFGGGTQLQVRHADG